MPNRAMPLGSVDAIKVATDNFKTNSLEHFQRILPVRKLIPLLNPESIRQIKESLSSAQKEEEASDVKVFFTKDPDLLKAYYDLRHTSYREENGWKEYDGSENEFDRAGKIVVAVRNGKVVGGMRIMFSDECDHMSNEIPETDYNYKKIITKYDKRENLVLAEISALVVEKNNRDSTVTTSMMDCLFNEAKAHGCHYIFGVAIALVCRNDRKTIKRLGYDVEIVMNFPWKQKGTYNFAKMFPMYTKLQ